MSNMGKYGIKGSTGLGVNGFFHVGAPYDCNGKVFVSIEDSEWGEVWKRVDAKKARGKKIIRCCMCDKPAVSLDHLWPYYSEYNRCKKHYNVPYSEELDKDYQKDQKRSRKIEKILGAAKYKGA